MPRSLGQEPEVGFACDGKYDGGKGLMVPVCPIGPEKPLIDGGGATGLNPLSCKQSQPALSLGAAPLWRFAPRSPRMVGKIMSDI
jgi:hypothetical protein